MLSGAEELSGSGWTAAAYAIASFVLPFAFSYAPALLLQSSLSNNLVAVATSFIGIGAIGVAVVGCLFAPLGWVSRATFGVAGLCLLFQGWVSAAIGIPLIVVGVILQRIKIPASTST